MMNQADDKQFPMDPNTISTTLRPEALPSVKHWMENATNEEREAVMKLFRTLSRSTKPVKNQVAQNGNYNSYANGGNIITRNSHQTPPIVNSNRGLALSRSKYSSSGKMEAFSDQNGGYHWRFKLPPVPPNTNGTFVFKNEGIKEKRKTETRQSLLEGKQSSNGHTLAPLVRPVRAEFDIAPDWRMNRKMAIKELQKSFGQSKKESALYSDY